MAKGFASAIGQVQQASAVDPSQAPQALQQLTQILHVVAGVHNEATYQAAKQMFEQQAGGKVKLTPHYNKTEVDNFKKILIKGIQHLQGAQPQAAPQQSAAPAPQEV